MSFIDEIKLYLKAGNGGNGCASFRREKYMEFGGPDGGNGGKGGDIIFIATHDTNTLLSLRYRQHIKAENGACGSGRQKTGASGADVVIKVPVGTQIFDQESGELIADLDTPRVKFVVANGGVGGAGNINFKTSTNRAPRRFTYGTIGEEKYVQLKLKVLSDVGIIGLPNAGKSSFLASCSRANPKIADYPFTTLQPQLGVAGTGDRELVLADIPGLIENAHLGYGLGHKFLKHIERCKVLLHLIDVSSYDIVSAYKSVFVEMSLYNAQLTEKPEIIVLSKCDLLDDAIITEKITTLKQYIMECRGYSPVIYRLSNILDNDKDKILHAAATYLAPAKPATKEYDPSI